MGTRLRPRLAAVWLALAWPGLSGCAGAPSPLDPQGPAARELAGLTWALLLLTLLALWPFLEARASGDRDVQHLLDTPSRRPLRTAIGVWIVTLLALLLVAGGNDVFAHWLGLRLELVVWVLRATVLAVPPAAALLAYLLCRRIARAGEL